MSTPASPTLSLQSILDPLTPHRPTTSVPRPTSSPSSPSRSIRPDAPPPYAPAPMIMPEAGSSRLLRSTRPPPPFHPSDPPSTSSPLGSPSRRHWYPTPNVPMRLHDRHAVARVTSGEEEERNRWLSEDEGAGGVTRSIGRRRRRRSNGQRCNDEPFDRDPPAGGPRTRSSDGPPKPPIVQDSATRSRPVVRRAMSFEPQSTPAGPSTTPIGAADVTVGAFPPQIEHIVPDPESAIRRHNVETRAARSVQVERSHPAPVSLPERRDEVDEPTPPPDSMTEAQKRRQAQRDTLSNLRQLLSCALCPITDGKGPHLHHPITLPCGHTMSSAHIPIPAPPPLETTSDLPHEIYAAQQRQHQQRLNIWASVMCPIPSCKRFSPIAATAVYRSDVIVGGSDTPTHSRSSSGQGETLASGVMYYPPPAVLPAYTAEATTHTESNPALLDVTIDKILELVNRELGRQDSPEDARLTHRSHDYEATDTESDDEAEPSSSALHTTISGDMASLGRTPATSRRVAKRQRNLLRSMSNDGDTWQFKKDLRAIVECDVCAMMLYDPVTTPCQHSFCYKCLSRSLDHSSRCPLCRQDLPGFAFFQDHNVNRVLLGIIKTVFGDAYAERQQGIDREERDALLDTPIFVCTLAFPGMPTILHVFEPRYRLMIRRCIESSSPRFGMVLPSRGTGAPGTHGVMEYGTMLEIQSVQMLPDGRSMVETVGTHRFKLLEKGNLDGYTVGRIERIDDISPEEELALEQQARAGVSSASSLGTPSSRAPVSIATDTILDIGAPSLGISPAFRLPSGSPIPGATPNQPASAPTAEEESRSTEAYMAICRSFIDQLRSGSAPWLLQRLNNTYGTMPTDPSEFSYWMALVMPIDEYEKAKLLPIRSPRLRLKLIVHWVESLRSSWWFSSGCVVG